MAGATREFTPTEAVAISDVAVKAVHNALDKRIADAAGRPANKRMPRKLTASDVLRLKLWQAVGGVLSQERRRRLFAEIAARPEAKRIKADPCLIIDVGEARQEIAGRTRELEAAEAAVTRSADTMGGEPVFKGTRIPVRMIAAMLDDGDRAEILQGYPKLAPHHLDLARMWVAAHPRRGRPKSLADRGLGVRSQTRATIRPDPGPTASTPHPSS